MANAAIAYSNLADAASITVSSAQILNPAANLQDPNVMRRWRSIDAGTGYALLDMGSSVSIDTVALIGMTMSSAGTLRTRISSSDSTGAAGDLYDSGAVAVDDNYNQAVIVLSAAVSGRYLRFDLNDSGAAYVEAGRVFAGVRTQFAVNFDFNWSVTRNDRSIITKTRGGQSQVWRDNKYRSLDVTFQLVDSSDRYGVIEAVEIANGTQTDILFIADTASTNIQRDSIWGLVTAATPIVEPNYNIFSKQYKIDERL